MSAVSPFGVTSVLIEADRCMDINHKKLRKLLIDRDMKKKDLEKAAGISNYVISKMNRNKKSRLKPWENLQSPELYSQRHYGLCARQQIKKIMNGTPYFVNSYSEAVCRKK